MKIPELQSMSRKEFSAIIGIDPKTLKKDLDKWVKQIKKIDPLFADRKLLKPIVIEFLHKKYYGESESLLINKKESKPEVNLY